MIPDLLDFIPIDKKIEMIFNGSIYLAAINPLKYFDCMSMLEYRLWNIRYERDLK